MKKLLSVIGLAFMVLGTLSLIYPFLIIFMGLYENTEGSRILRRFFWEGVIPVLFIFALTFFPGRIYYSLSKKDSTNRLQNWSAVLSLLSLIALLLFVLLGVISADAEGFIWGLFILGPFMLIPYALGLLLLIINWIKTKSL